MQLHSGGGGSVSVTGGGVNVNTKNGTNVSVGGGGVNVNHHGKHHGDHGDDGGDDDKGDDGKGGVNVRTRTKNGKPVYVHVAPGPHPFQYNYAATQTQLHDDTATALFFLERDLFAGKRMTLRFSNPTTRESFLPRRLADSIPFSGDKLPEIYSKFSVAPNSDEAAAIKKTIGECEAAAVAGEEKLCATSLESMVDFSTSALGTTEVSAVSTAADKAERETYRVAAVRRLPSEKAVVVCHQQEYPYAVYYCHKTATTAAYSVSLVGGGGATAEAVAVCHRDTAAWNPKHLAFQVLNVKPGTLPVCHFLPANHVVWVSKN